MTAAFRQPNCPDASCLVADLKVGHYKFIVSPETGDVR
jgi:hypothetical protein